MLRTAEKKVLSNCFSNKNFNCQCLPGRPLHRLECWLHQDLPSRTSLPALSFRLQPLLYPPCMSNLYLLSDTYTGHDDGSSMAGRYETTRSCAKDTAAHLRLLSHPFNMPASTTKASVSGTGKLALAAASSVFEECIEDSLVYTNTLAGQCQVCLFHTFKWLYPT